MNLLFDVTSVGALVLEFTFSCRGVLVVRTNSVVVVALCEGTEVVASVTDVVATEMSVMVVIAKRMVSSHALGTSMLRLS